MAPLSLSLEDCTTPRSRRGCLAVTAIGIEVDNATALVELLVFLNELGAAERVGPDRGPRINRGRFRLVARVIQTEGTASSV